MSGVRDAQRRFHQCSNVPGRNYKCKIYNQAAVGSLDHSKENSNHEY